MIRGRLKRAQFLVTLAFLCLPVCSFAIAGYLRFGTHLLPNYSADVDPFGYFGLLVITTIVWAIMSEKYELTSIEIHLFAATKIRKAILASSMTFLAVLAITFFYRQATFSRLFMWISSASLFALAILVQFLVGRMLRLKRSAEKTQVSVLVVGADEFAVRVADSLLGSPLGGCAIKGYIRLPGQPIAARGQNVYDLADMGAIAIGNGFDEVVIAIPPALLPGLPNLRAALAPLCVPIRLVLDVGGIAHDDQRLFRIGNLLLLDVQSTPAESAVYVTLKHLFDLAFSGCVLLVTAPLMLLIAVAVRLSSPGPIIFSQDRVGLNGKLFRMYKFRTMKVSSLEESDQLWTVRGDPRCTRIGVLLRQTGLDELPQFFNVLKGEMSVVGPRPERPLLVQKFMQSVGNYNTRHYLKVGITGWAQVNGWRGDTSIEKRVEYDLYYVRNWTLAFDLFIVLLTFLRGFTDKNAY